MSLFVTHDSLVFVIHERGQIETLCFCFMSRLVSCSALQCGAVCDDDSDDLNILPASICIQVCEYVYMYVNMLHT